MKLALNVILSPLFACFSYLLAVNAAEQGGRDESMSMREEERQQKVLPGSGQKEEGDSRVDHKASVLSVKSGYKRTDCDIALSVFLLRR